ncbi:MAG TPA: hypothetical protein VN820_05850 [Acidimicrobiales bacterium]|nr:hypothetical protein [Acidimicrobiales bacterium]
MIRRLALAVLVTALPLLAVLTTAITTSAPPAAAASTPLTAYWLVASDGGIFSFGGAPFYGSTGGMVLNKPIVGMAVTPDGGGYWLVASDGGIFSYGDAQFYGSTGSMTLNKPIVGMAPTPDGKGYWLVASDGGIFSYGDAQFHGSTGSLALNKPVIGMITGPNGAGYFLVASDGGIFSFGSAPFYGSLGGLPLKNPIVAATAISDGSGYWFSDSAGLVSNFGAAKYYGSAPSPLNRPIVGMADAPGNGSFVGGTYPSGAYGYDISVYQCSSFPSGDHQIGIVQVDGSSSGNTNPCLAQEAAWAGGGLNLYTYLTYGTSTTPEPGCGGDTSCNAGYQAGISAYRDAQNAGAGSTTIPWWLDVETANANWSADLSENAQFVQGAINALHESEGIPDVGIYASPGVWNTIVGDYTPSVPYWMADYLASPSGPGSCADYQNWVTNHGAQLPGPPEIVQYNSAQYDEDYAC